MSKHGGSPRSPLARPYTHVPAGTWPSGGGDYDWRPFLVLTHDLWSCPYSLPVTSTLNAAYSVQEDKVFLSDVRKVARKGSLPVREKVEQSLSQYLCVWMMGTGNEYETFPPWFNGLSPYMRAVNYHLVKDILEFNFKQFLSKQSRRHIYKLGYIMTTLTQIMRIRHLWWLRYRGVGGEGALPPPPHSRSNLPPNFPPTQTQSRACLAC